MPRVRTNNVFGTVSDNPLTNSATTLNSAGLANLAAVSSAEAIIVLDPNRVAGAPEIVVVTAHTGSATSATIQRGQFGTSARQHAQGTEWVHGPITTNATSYATAADDQGDYVPMNEWQSWSPVITQSNTPAQTVNSARFIRIGRTIIANFSITFNGAGTAANNITLTGLPVTTLGTALACGSFRYLDTGNTNFVGAIQINASATTALFYHDGDGNALGNGSHAIASNDFITGTITYEAAS